jgi:hypothetical protein
MIRHVVVFRFKEGVSSDQIDALDAALRALPGRISEIRSYTTGRDLDLTPSTSDYAVVAEFDTVDDYRTYASHRDHVTVIEKLVTPLITEATRVQFVT